MEVPGRSTSRRRAKGDEEVTIRSETFAARAAFTSAAVAALAVLPGRGDDLDAERGHLPRRASVDVPFLGTVPGPKAAELGARVKASGPQTEIRLEWKAMEPAVLFAGNITSYSLWAITRDGRTENLGEVPVREKKAGKAVFRTGQKDFALVVTAEVLPGSEVPTELAVFTSGAADPRRGASNREFTYEATYPVQGVIRPGNPSIALLSYAAKGSEPIELQQARKALELAKEIGAGAVDGASVEAAERQLAQAQGSAAGGSRSAVVDYARRSLENSAVAVRLAFQKAIREALAAREARDQELARARERELAAAKARADEARGEAIAATAQAAAAEAERGRIASELDRLKREREQLQTALKDALGKYMRVSESARGIVVDMGDILFDVNKATLKRDAELAVAKVSGILAVFQRVSIRVEGHTDSTGTEAFNRKLSAERARAVAEFLEAQGIAAARIAHAGYGPANPVAPNDTKEGRARNRRVEVILNEGGVERHPVARALRRAPRPAAIRGCPGPPARPRFGGSPRGPARARRGGPSAAGAPPPVRRGFPSCEAVADAGAERVLASRMRRVRSATPSTPSRLIARARCISTVRGESLSFSAISGLL